MSDDLEVSERGIKLSYGRFLADSAGGYVLILVTAFLIISSLDQTTLTSAKNLESGVFVVAGVLLLLMGPPLGLALNSASWFLLGWIQVWALNLWANGDWKGRIFTPLTCNTSRSYNKRHLQDSFIFFFSSASKKPEGTRWWRRLRKDSQKRAAGERNDHYSQTRLLEHVMRISFSRTVEKVEYLTGITIFVRNMSLLTLVAAFFPSNHNRHFTIATVGLTWLACHLEVYKCLEILFSAYAICLGKELRNSDSDTRPFDAYLQPAKPAPPTEAEDEPPLLKPMTFKQVLTMLVTPAVRDEEKPA